jgi:uncharacterized protein YndB with AHSA1/START domain
MSERPRGYALRFEVNATAKQIWDVLVAPQLQAIWHPPGIEIDARQGGVWRMRLDDRIEREAHIDVFLPPHRMRLVYMPITGVGTDDAVLVDDIIIDASREGSTRLCVLGSGFPARVEWVQFYLQVQAVWRQACSRIKILAEKQAARR